MTIQKVGVIGWPIDHSLSPAMHNAAFAALGMTDWLYDKMAIPPDVLGHSVNELRRHDFIGINVTVPHKEAIMRYVQADQLAQTVGAVNTVDFRTGIGTNTDVAGFLGDLAANGVPVQGQRVVVLGAGGAARAVVYGLAQSGAEVAVVNRSLERALDLARTLLVPFRLMTLQEAADWGASLIVNCTPAGMQPNVTLTPWHENVPFPKGVTLYDTIYRPAQTNLMRQAEAASGQAFNGSGMLVRQGAAAFKLWTGVEPPVDVMMDALLKSLRSA
ncbi:MAG: shikimate dehydrogenase [Anaerolineae bacterium]|nr:shikimate dehydrogenase [Anaerolineae bacterium]